MTPVTSVDGLNLTSFGFHNLSLSMGQGEGDDEDMITDGEYHYILMGFMQIWLILACCGIFTNIINIITFVRMGLEDSVTISFFSLSISDLVASIIAFFHAMTAILRIVQRELNIVFKMDPFAFAVFCAHYRRMAYDVTVLTTTFLALQRCFCVAMPFHFRGAFTRRRTLIVLSCICLFSLGCYLPMFVTHGLVLKFDPDTNRTRYLLWMSDKRNTFMPITEVITAIVIPTTSQIIVIVCLVIMALCLKKARRFRTEFALAPGIFKISNSSYNELKYSFKSNKNEFDNPAYTVCEHSIKDINLTTVSGDSFGNDDDSPTNVSKSLGSGMMERDSNGSLKNHPSKCAKTLPKPTVREMQVVKAVALVSLVFIICNTPKIITASLRQIVSGFDIGGRLHNTYSVGNCIRFAFELFNSAINFIIYRKYNSKFRKHCFLTKNHNDKKERKVYR